ncbi:MAG: helix-turn-helix domain-containing protein [Bacteroidota bacterium]
MNFFSKNIEFLRNFHKLKQNEIPDSIGFGRTVWNQYEKGKSYPSFLDLLKISDYFKVGLSELVEIDLTKNVHLISVDGESKKRKNVHLNVHPSVHLSLNKGLDPDILTVANEPTVPFGYINRMPQVITVDTHGNENVILVPVKARAGYLNGYADPEFIQSLPAYRLPGLNNGSFRLFEVEGLSMYPTLNSGDLVIGSNVEQLSIVRDDRVHVVVTKNDGLVVKRVLNRLKTDGKFILKSDNYKDRDLFPPIVVDPQDIIEIWYATGFISRQMRPPAEMYNRLIDLEGRLTLLEDRTRKSSGK